MTKRDDKVRSNSRELEDFRDDIHGPANLEQNGNPNIKRIAVIFLLLSAAIIFAGWLFSNFHTAKRNLTDSAGATTEKFKSAVEDLKSLRPEEAQKKFSDIEQSLRLESLSDAVSKFTPLFGGGVKVIAGLQKLAGEGAIVAKGADFLTSNFLNLFINKRGEEILRHLESVEKALSEIDNASKNLSSETEELRSIMPGAADIYLPLRFDLGRFNGFLSALVSWLKLDSRRLFLMLQNPSELRPTGGFLGSYAEVLIKNAGLENVDVYDINDIDRELGLKVVPPKPLQAIVTSWRTADANWFFDFPRSAEQVLTFAESSSLYNVSGTKFDGAIAASPKILEDILSLTGQLELPQSKIKLDSKNFLIELQKIVQQGQAQTRSTGSTGSPQAGSGQAATYPKKVLKELTPLLLERLANLDDVKKREIFGKVQDWILKRDLVFYLREPQLQKFLGEYGMTGAVYDLPQDFQGDYLAVVDANIGGGKSDLFVKSDVSLESQIQSDGTVSNHLVVSREHQGNKSSYWWYKVINQDYLQIFTSPASQLINFRGGIDKSVKPPVNYEKSGYLPDSYISELESQTEKIFNYPAVSAHDESGKRVFATWSKVSAGKKTQIIFDYKHRLFLPPEPGQTYQFIFEKQAGTKRHYKFELSAPVGFRFRENGLPVYEYETDDLSTQAGPPGRLVINLTLEKI